jgi:hypothetical protein
VGFGRLMTIIRCLTILKELCRVFHSNGHNELVEELMAHNEERGISHKDS